jgi:hypothetical protein
VIGIFGTVCFRRAQKYIKNNFRSTFFSVVDPDLHGFAFILVGRIGIGNAGLDSDPGGQNLSTKVKKFKFLNAG